MFYLFLLEIIGTIAFSISGSILAIKSKMDLLGVIIISIISSLGGGLLRDVVLNESIVLFEKPIYLAISIVVALIIFVIFYTKNNISFFYDKLFKEVLNIIDGVGLGVFVIVGANAALSITNNILLVVFCSLLTAVGGGVVRDVMINKIPIIFRKYIYALAALLGVIIYLIMYYLDLEQLGTIITILIVTIVRVVSQKYKLSLPRIKE